MHCCNYLIKIQLKKKTLVEEAICPKHLSETRIKREVLSCRNCSADHWGKRLYGIGYSWNKLLVYLSSAIKTLLREIHVPRRHKHVPRLSHEHPLRTNGTSNFSTLYVHRRSDGGAYVRAN